MHFLTYPVNGSHAETARLMSDHAESELRGYRRWRVARHLAHCDMCRAAFRSFLATLEHLRGLGRAEPAPKPEIADSVVARIRAAERR